MINRKAILLGVVGLVIVGGLIIAYAPEPEPRREVSTPETHAPVEPAPPQVTVQQLEAQAAQAKNQAKLDYDISVAQGGAKLLRDAMRDPASFSIVRAVLMPFGGVCYTYRAANGFGGKTVEQAVMDGTQMLVESQAGFTKAWNRTCAKSGAYDVTKEVSYFLEVAR